MQVLIISILVGACYRPRHSQLFGVFSKATPMLRKLIEDTLDMPTRFRTCYLAPLRF